MILLDLFSGIGGFHKGLTDAGFQFSKVYFSEIDKYAIANYKYNFNESEYIGTVEQVVRAGIERPNIITFGSPCQDFSLSGKRKGLSGKRSGLIEHAIAAVSHFRPDIYIWENVKGTFSSNNREDFTAIIKAFAEIGGYRLEWQLLNTSWLLPQNRERIYFVGRLANLCRGEVFPIGENDSVLEKKATTNKGWTQASDISTTLRAGGVRADNTFIEVPKIVRTLTGGGNSGGLHSQMTTIRTGAIRGRYKIGEPGTEQVLEINQRSRANALTSVDKDNVVVEITQRGRGRNKGGVTDVCPTITSNSFQHNHYVNNIRRFTEIEEERLQGFPDDWTKYGNFDGQIRKISSTQRYKMLGNAVTSDIVQLVGKKILMGTELQNDERK